MAAEITASPPIRPRTHSAATNQQRAGEAPPHTVFVRFCSLKGFLKEKGNVLGNVAAKRDAVNESV